MSAIRRCVRALCVTTALLGVCASLPLSVAADEVVTADKCAMNPSSSITVTGYKSPRGDSYAYNGAVFECPVTASGSDFQITTQFFGIKTDPTDDGKTYRGTSTGTICSPSGDCETASGVSYHYTVSAPGAYTLKVITRTQSQSGDFTAKPLVCDQYDNRVCTNGCRQCTQTITATCYYADPQGLAAALAASPNNGAGDNTGTIIGASLSNGTPFAASSFGASLPLSAGQTLNPRCRLDTLWFGGYATTPALGDNYSSDSYPFALPTDGSDTVVVYDCSGITDAQVKRITGDKSSGSTYLHIKDNAGLVCKNVLTFNGNQLIYDQKVQSYSFSGDLQTSTSGSGTQIVCQDSNTRGPVAGLPAASWRSATFAVTSTHTPAFSLCTDESCIGGNADGRCSSCSYTYHVRFSCDVPPPTTPTPTPTPPSSGGGGIIGDPQFVGLRGQQYQVHGVAGEVYSIVSAPELQYNARFVFLSSGACPVVGGKTVRKGCYSHPGSYLGELGLKTAAGADLIRIEAGGATSGFAAVTLNERELAVGETALLSDAAGGSQGSISRNSSHTASVRVGAWSFVFDNSDLFINQRVAVSGDVAALRSHGLLGQTWRERTYPHSPIKFIQGQVDDYAIRDGDIFGDDFAYNAFD